MTQNPKIIVFRSRLAQRWDMLRSGEISTLAVPSPLYRTLKTLMKTGKRRTGAHETSVCVAFERFHFCCCFFVSFRDVFLCHFLDADFGARKSGTKKIIDFRGPPCPWASISAKISWSPPKKNFDAQRNLI